MINWNKEFPVISITRRDLKDAGLSEKQIAQLTDEDMTAIASKMEDMYCESGFWEVLRITATMRFEFGNLS